MIGYICRTCGVQYAPSETTPPGCIICDDERQYIGWGGQAWTTLEEMKAAGYRNELREEEPGLTGIGTVPSFGIGQRALLARTPHGNVLWDCLSYLDEETIARVKALGGIAAIGISHPHFYGSMVEWGRAFGAPVYIPQADSRWVVAPDSCVRFWEGAQEALPGATLVQCGGHFDGSAVLHWAAGAGGKGALLAGDTISVVRDRRYVSFMWSYPNLIPLPARAVRQIVDAVRPYPFDRIYGLSWGAVVAQDARKALELSAERYIQRTRG